MPPKRPLEKSRTKLTVKLALALVALALGLSHPVLSDDINLLKEFVYEIIKPLAREPAVDSVS